MFLSLSVHRDRFSLFILNNKSFKWDKHSRAGSVNVATDERTSSPTDEKRSPQGWSLPISGSKNTNARIGGSHVRQRQVGYARCLFQCEAR